MSRKMHGNLFKLSMLLALAAALAGCSKLLRQKVCLARTCLWAEVADTPARRAQGLMYRKGLPEGQGMLFLFEHPAIYSFWMKNMSFPLDLIWIDENRRVAEIYQNALPCKDICKNLVPARPIKYVLEVNAGFAREHGLKPGDPVVFRPEK